MHAITTPEFVATVDEVRHGQIVRDALKAYLPTCPLEQQSDTEQLAHFFTFAVARAERNR